MRIIAGRFRGRALRAPAGDATRPTADRVRQALFDSLMHAPWGGRTLFEGATVLDAFAGTGALGLEALSRGAARAVFFEQDRAALAAVRANVAACHAEGAALILARDVTRPGRAEAAASVAFFDPPYDAGLLRPAVEALRAAGWLAPGCVMISETSRLESVVEHGMILAQREHGAARLTVWRA